MRSYFKPIADRIYGTLDPWLLDLHKKLDELYGQQDAEATHLVVTSARSHKARLIPCTSDDEILKIPGLDLEADTRLLARVTENKRLTRDDWFQDVRHVELDVREEETT